MTDVPDAGVDRAPQPAAVDHTLLELLEEQLLGQRPYLTQAEAAERAGVPLELARELWHQLGFAHTQPDAVAFGDGDVEAMRLTKDLIDLGLLNADRQEGLVRTWGRSFARLAEWQASLLAEVAAESGQDPDEALIMLGQQALPRVEKLQAFTWRRHLLSAGGRLLANTDNALRAGVCFVDIVGYTSRSRTLSEAELVDWLEHFETTALAIVVERGGRIIKNIGDELLIAADSPVDIAEIALSLVELGADPEDDFPSVRAGVAYGDVVSRLGDVYGPVVNIAARLTSVARPGSVLIDRGLRAALGGEPDTDADDTGDEPDNDASAYRFRRLRRISVKGYSRLQVWVLSRRAA